MGNLAILLAELLHGLIALLQLLVLIQVVLSWMAVGLPLNPLTRLFHTVVEALYRPIRSVVPTTMGGVDFAPMIALGLLYLVDTTLVSAMLSTGYRWSR